MYAAVHRDIKVHHFILNTAYLSCSAQKLVYEIHEHGSTFACATDKTSTLDYTRCCQSLALVEDA